MESYVDKKYARLNSHYNIPVKKLFEKLKNENIKIFKTVENDILIYIDKPKETYTFGNLKTLNELVYFINNVSKTGDIETLHKTELSIINKKNIKKGLTIIVVIGTVYVSGPNNIVNITLPNETTEIITVFKGHKVNEEECKKYTNTEVKIDEVIDATLQILDGVLCLFDFEKSNKEVLIEEIKYSFNKLTEKEVPEKKIKNFIDKQIKSVVLSNVLYHIKYKLD